MEKYKEVFSEIIWEIKTPNGGKQLFSEKNYARIGVKQTIKIYKVKNNH